MTPKEIDLYRCIQHRKGNWRVGDRAWCFDCKTTHTITNFVYFCPKHKIHGEKQMYQYIWLPPVWSDDGRCLWAWVDWKKHTLFIHSDGLVTVDVHSDSAMSVCHKVPLPEALLRAIREQEDSHE